MPSAFCSYALCLKRGLHISALLLCATLLTACVGPAPADASRSETPQGKTPPRTALPMPPTNAASGQPNAQVFTLLNNQQARLSDYLGKVVVLDFWATYCKPCLEEVPHLDALQKRFAAQGLQVIGLNVGGPEDHPRIPEFVERLKVRYTLGIAEPEMLNFYTSGDPRIPQTIVFDRQGRIVKHFVGYDQAASLELERTIEKAVTGDR
jgi:thiol-disulfide isomerase/thioredoxin